MISFANEEVRAEFHSLPLDKQFEILEIAKTKDVFVEGVFHWSETESETCIRINEKINPTSAVV